MRLSADLLTSMKDTLIAGGYSLLFGAGASFDSKNAAGDLPLGDKLKIDLIKLKNLRPQSSLARAYGALTQGEIDTYITDRFIDCLAGPSLLKVPPFNWRRIYTLNIDDALEAAYKTISGHQKPVPLTHLSPYMEATDVDSIQLVFMVGREGQKTDMCFRYLNMPTRWHQAARGQVSLHTRLRVNRSSLPEPV